MLSLTVTLSLTYNHFTPLPLTGFLLYRLGVSLHLPWECLLLDRVLHTSDAGGAHLAQGGLLSTTRQGSPHFRC